MLRPDITGHRFKHFKGDTYLVVADAIPVFMIEVDGGDVCIGIAHDCNDPTVLYPVFREAGPYGRTVLFGWNGDSDNARFVIYQSEKTGMWWMRAFDEFMGMHESGVQRFAQIEDLHPQKET